MFCCNTVKLDANLVRMPTICCCLLKKTQDDNLKKKSVELMQIAADWGRSVGVEVSVDKTVMMLMKGSQSHTRTLLVRYGVHAVKYVTEVKYLGLTVCEQLQLSSTVGERKAEQICRSCENGIASRLRTWKKGCSRHI